MNTLSSILLTGMKQKLLNTAVILLRAIGQVLKIAVKQSLCWMRQARVWFQRQSPINQGRLQGAAGACLLLGWLLLSARSDSDSQAAPAEALPDHYVTSVAEPQAAVAAAALDQGAESKDSHHGSPQSDEVQKGAAPVTQVSKVEETSVARVSAVEPDLRSDHLYYLKGESTPFSGSVAVKNGGAAHHRAEGSYQKGKRVGSHQTRHENGKLARVENYQDGLIHGDVLTFDKAGVRLKAVRFDQGKQVSVSEGAPVLVVTGDSSRDTQESGSNAASDTATSLSSRSQLEGSLQMQQREASEQAALYRAMAEQEAYQSMQQSQRNLREQYNRHFGALR
jgi:hypothetical protein